METLMQHTKEQPPPPSTRTELTIPSALDQLILACLAKNPDDRPATADAVAAQLDEIDTSSLWTQARAQHWWELNHPTRVEG